MATDPATVDFILDQASGVPGLSARKMFGEYAIYAGARVVALVCDDRLFLKPTPGALTLVSDPQYGAPYPGAKPHLLIEAELDDPDLLAGLFLATAAGLPEPKPKKPRKKVP